MKRYLAVPLAAVLLLMSACAGMPSQAPPPSTAPAPVPTPTPTLALEAPSPSGMGHTKITDVTWDPDMRTIHIELDSWPGVWDEWKMYVDGVEIPMKGGVGEPVVRPDAPLDQPPTGVIVGTLPWVTGLDHIDFPCCGTIQFYIPSDGLTQPSGVQVERVGSRHI